MPIVTFRSPFDRFRGSTMDVGGSGLVVYDSSKSGNVARAYVVPENPQSANQVFVRNNLISAAQGFAALSASVAETWNVAANDYKRLNELGVEYEFSGINLYCQVNAMRLLNGAALTNTPPVKLTLPIIAASSITAIIASSPNDTMTVGFTNTLAPAGDTFHALILVTSPWITPARKPRRNDFRMRDEATPANNTVDITDTNPDTIALVNTAIPITTADVVHVMVKPISADYVPGPIWIQASKTIAAP